MKKICAIFSGLFLVGCAAVFNANMDRTTDLFVDGDFDGATRVFVGTKDAASQNNLELLVSGNNLFNSGKFSESDNVFEEFNRRDIDYAGFSLTREASSFVGGQMSAAYRPYMMDALFVYYYQIWAALAENRWSDARVIINQSYAQQQQMSVEYKKLIEKNQSEIQSNMDLANEIMSRNSQWMAYSEIMNPALMYLAGIYFLSDGDFANAQTYLSRVNGMMSKNKYVHTDLNLANAKSRAKNTTWIFVETGFAPRLFEDNLNVPILLSGGPMMTTIGISVPAFNNDSLKINNSELIANVDAMFMTEYREYSVNSALRSALNAMSRTALQTVAYASNSKNSSLLGLSAMIFSAATSDAEVRTWATLPEYIYTIRKETPKSGLIELQSGGNVIANIEVPNNGNNIVYVRVLKNTPVVHVMKLR